MCVYMFKQAWPKAVLFYSRRLTNLYIAYPQWDDDIFSEKLKKNVHPSKPDGSLNPHVLQGFCCFWLCWSMALCFCVVGGSMMKATARPWRKCLLTMPVHGSWMSSTQPCLITLSEMLIDITTRVSKMTVEPACWFFWITLRGRDQQTHRKSQMKLVT